MRLRVLPKEQVPDMVRALMADYRVWGPKAKGPQFAFEPLYDPAEMRLDYNISILSPKVALQPPTGTDGRRSAWTRGRQPSSRSWK
jgi:hypothetical protein